MPGGSIAGQVLNTRWKSPRSRRARSSNSCARSSRGPKWIEVVDDVFAEAFRSEKYIRIQGRLVNSATAYRVRERELADAFLKTTHIASRSELDEAYRNIYTLRKEVKELKKMIQGAKAHAPAAAVSKSPEATA
ncbi:MAG: hypothetical protein E6K60_08040 [Nitrospirae bacterium]|nr:MAG: hypothetical protein E6K60_08040 [Nitrospirota bacterium]